MNRLRDSRLLEVLICLITLIYLSSSIVESAPKEPNVTFAIMSDIHIHKHNRAVHRRFMQALEDYHHIHPTMDFMVINGDLTNGFPSHYDVLRRLLHSVPHPPIYFTPGNHDFYKMLYNKEGKLDFKNVPNGWSSEQAMELFKDFTGYDKPYHDTWVNGYHFIFLAPEKSRDFDLSIGKNGYISEAQLNWLNEKLNERTVDAEKPKFVFFHQPLPNTVSGSQYDVNIVQHRKLRRILDQHPEVIFFSGHTHYNLRTTEQQHVDTFLMLGSSSVMRHGESLYVEVYDDYVDIHSRDHLRGEWIADKFLRYRPS